MSNEETIREILEGDLHLKEVFEKSVSQLLQLIETKPKLTMTYSDLTNSCCICAGRMVATGATLHSDPPRKKYVCKECNETEFRVV
jgi:hypothetical protein